MIPEQKQLLESGIDKIRARYGHYSVQGHYYLKIVHNSNPAEENVIHPYPILGKVVFMRKVFVEAIVKYTKDGKKFLFQLHGKMEESI